MKRHSILNIVRKIQKIFLIVLIVGFISLAAGDSSYILDDVSKDTEYFLNITEEEHEYLPGKETEVYSFNDEVPGPVVRAEKGEKISVKVENNLDEPTTVHWHGIQLPNEMDGVPEITQKPIESGETKTYEFKLENPGTYWYHSHFNTDEQVEKGLQAPIVVDYEDEPYNYQQDKILVVDDIALNDDGEHLSFDGGQMHGRHGNYPLVNGEIDPKIQVEQGKIKLRLINTANARTFNIGIENEDFKVVASDIGLNPEPYKTKNLQIAPGQRYEIIINTDNQEKMEIYDQGSRDKKTLTTLTPEESVGAHVKWKRQLQNMMSRVKQIFVKQEQKEFEDWELNKSLYERPPDHAARLQPLPGDEGLNWAINEKTYPENPEVFELNEDELYKFEIRNEHGEPHPMHLHGQKFKIMTRNGEKIENPSWRDTVLVEGHETVEIGFKAEGKGQWAFHCHTLEHSKAGMLSKINITEN